MKKEHRISFEDESAYCLGASIRLVVGYVVFFGLVIGVAAVVLGALTTNYTLIVAYALVILFNIILLAGHLHKYPTFYAFYIVGNWAIAWISMFLFGVAWMLYWVDDNRWIKHKDSQVWRWSGLPFDIDDRWLIFAFSIAFIVNYLVQHLFVFTVKRAYQNLIQDLIRE